MYIVSIFCCFRSPFDAGGLGVARLFCSPCFKHAVVEMEGINEMMNLKWRWGVVPVMDEATAACMYGRF